jgi:signal transduction histidine kinase/DNA-binding NarL/FixJ family response regulator
MGMQLVRAKKPRKPPGFRMENSVNAFDAPTWIGRLSVHQDFFWFFSLLVWFLALILWWRHPEGRRAWAWLPGAGGAAVATALLQFGLFNPTFDFLQDRLIPGTVSDYVPALIDPYWLGDVLMGAALAAMVAGWGWLAARQGGRPHLRWLPALLMVGVAALHVLDPRIGGGLLVVAAGLSARALRPQVGANSAALVALLAAALLPVFSTVGPLAAALQALQRSGPPTALGLGTALFQLLLGLGVLLSLRRGLPDRLPAETIPAFRRDTAVYWAITALLLLVGIAWAVQTGRDNRREIQQNRLRMTAAQARLFDPALLAPLHRPEFKIEWRDTAGEAAPARSGWLAGGVAEPARRRLAEVVIATPFLDHARLLLIHDGWLVAVLSSRDRVRPGEIEVLRRATAADLAQWDRKEPHVEESPVAEIGQAYYCRAPIIAPGGRMLGWLDGVRREYYLSVERRWRAAPFLMTALGVGLVTLVFVQRQIAREREIALRAAAVSAEGNRIKSAFLANVSHELRTPLQSILGYTELLAPGLADEKSLTRLAALRQQGELMTRLVNDLIDLSAVEAGSFQLALGPVDPAGLVRQTVEGLRPRAEAKGLALRLAIDHRLPSWVAADADRWRQVLVNLVANALKFTDRGSVSVWFRGEPGPDGRQRFTLAVCDTGPGIAPAQQGRLFTAFSRLEPTAAKEGSGLGLALSAALCRAMGGDITVESDGATGSCFTATFRATPCAAPEEAGATAVARPGFAPRVLVVDDNTLVRELFVSALTERGARCRAAASGAEGLALMAAEKPDVLVLDLALPDGDGAGFVPRFRALAPGVRIIGASAHAGAADQARALAAGMDALLVKPVALDALWAALAGAAPAAAPGPGFFDLPPALRDRLRAEFVRELPARRTELAAAVAAADWPRARAAAHYLRNSALVVQAGTLFEACTALEAAAIAQDSAGTAEAWPRCRAALDALVAP